MFSARGFFNVSSSVYIVRLTYFYLMVIRIFTTGGTFDKEYDPISQTLVFTETRVPKILDRSRCAVQCVVTNLMSIDSLQMKDEHRKAIAEKCKNVAEDKIIITHGTDTVVKTAEVLAREITNKTIILTGALIPYAFRNSDSLFNLGAAIALVQTMPNGVYIAMNGKVFPWNKTQKNTKTGMFEELK